jgi:CNT family concentrative nucleoside transporter
MTWQLDLQALAGIGVFILLALPFSSRWRAIRWRTVFVAVLLQFAIGFLLLRVPAIADALGILNRGVAALSEATRAGTSFVFGYVGGGAPPFAVVQGESLQVFAFQALTLIVVVSALSAVLWHWRVLPVLIRAIAWCFERTLGTTGPAGFAVAANVFVGQVEAPLLVRPHLATMSRGELLLLMTAGMAMIAGSMMVVYSTLLVRHLPNVPAHLLIKSLMSVPASILFAHLMLPDDVPSSGEAAPGRIYRGTMDALTRGTADGLRIWLNVIAILLVVVALVALANRAIGALPPVAGGPLTLERIVGWAFAPIAWLTGIPWAEAADAGALLGVKSILNEFISYLRLSAMDPAALSARTKLVVVYALCGFANVASMGIQVSGIAAMAPERRDDLNDLAWRALAAATLASCMSAAIVGIVAS